MGVDEPGSPDTDDLTRLPGVGPVIAARLRDAGVRRFAQIAASSPRELVRLLTGIRSVTEHTIARLDWIDGAARLARSSETPGSGGTGDETTDDAVAYESFVVRVTVRTPGAVGAVRLQRIRDGSVRHVPDLASAFREIGTVVAVPRGDLRPRRSPAASGA